MILAADFDWRLNACKFFVLDKYNILKGIITTTALTHVDMLMQMEISLE